MKREKQQPQSKKTNGKPVAGQTELRSLSRRVTKIEKLLWEVADFNYQLVEGIRGYEEAAGGMIGPREEWSKPLLEMYRAEERKEIAERKRQREVSHGNS